MMSFFGKIIFKITLFFNSRKLKDQIMYEDQETSTYVFLSKAEKLLKVYVDGMMFNIPINNKITDTKSFLEAVGKTEDLNFQNNTIDELESMLNYYEDQEDFTKCSKIRDAINLKINTTK